jgi:hypothetical protein
MLSCTVGLGENRKWTGETEDGRVAHARVRGWRAPRGASEDSKRSACRGRGRYRGCMRAEMKGWRAREESEQASAA